MVRLSDVSQMNDSHENLWLDIALKGCMEEFNKDKIFSLEDEAHVWAAYEANKLSSFAFCMTEAKDLLSQWRGYANDGSGVAIGISKNAFPVSNYLPCRSVVPEHTLSLRQVVYDNVERRKELQGVLLGIQEKLMSSNDRVIALWSEFSKFSSLATIYKNSAFAEEKEWRLLHTPYFEYPIASPLTMRQIVMDDRIKTFFEYSLSSVEENFLIEIWLGPKCQISDFDLKMFLNFNGYRDIKIYKSEATYR